MTITERWAYVVALICYAPLPHDPACTAVAQETRQVQHEPAAHTSAVLSQPLPRLKGDSLRVQVVRVHYGPGESSSTHSHPCPVVGYVLEGAVRMQVQDPDKEQPGPVTIYRAGDSFFEAPNGRHLISANASQFEPATFLATFVCDHATTLSVRSPNTNGGRS